MTSRRTSAVTAAALAVAHLLVVLAPAATFVLTARKGGVPGWHGLDLLLGSALVGTVHAVVVHRRMREALRSGSDVTSAVIAAVDALVVLALGATLLMLVVLGGMAGQYGVLVNRGWPVLLLWVGTQIAAVFVAEAVHAKLHRWLVAEQS